MLVLTTMFINVSNNLPKTSYMKMVDVWLLFNLLLPFIIVLLHTYMDTLRNDEEREINHHGKTIQVNEENSENLIKVLMKINISESRKPHLGGKIQFAVTFILWSTFQKRKECIEI